MLFSLSDDSGILGLLDCSSYSPFLGEDWEYEQLLKHFTSQAGSKSIVVWDAGDGGNDYRVDIRLEATGTTGYREALSQVAVTSGRLYLASYTAITMAAQFADELLPAKTEAECCITLANGEYAVRVIQMYNPNLYDELPDDNPHFVIEVFRSSGKPHGNVIWMSA